MTQGSFLTLSAHSIARSTSSDVAPVTAKLASGAASLHRAGRSTHGKRVQLQQVLHWHSHPNTAGFAAIYVGLEVVFKLMASVIQQEFGRSWVFIT
jgi:hypothetical protein